jgi:hypothetical protein
MEGSEEMANEVPGTNEAVKTNEVLEAEAEAKHRGDFAEGEEKQSVAPGTLMGDFAAGEEETPRTGTVQPVGDFASGEEETPADPTALRGDFARGQEETPRK